METKPPSGKSGCYNNLFNNYEERKDFSSKVEKKINNVALNKMVSNQAIIFGHLVQAILNKNALPFTYKLKKRKKKKQKNKKKF